MYNCCESFSFEIYKLIENDRDPKWVKILSRYDIVEIYNLLVIERLVFAPLVIDCIQSALWKKKCKSFFYFAVGRILLLFFQFCAIRFHRFKLHNRYTPITTIYPVWIPVLILFRELLILAVSFFKFSNMSIFKIEQNIPICGWEYARMFR